VAALDDPRAFVRATADRLLRRALERVTGSAPVLVPEYPLDLRARWGWGQPAMAAVEALLAAKVESYEQLVADVAALREWAHQIPRQQSRAGEPCWFNDYWGTIDAVVQCAMLSRRNPALYLEIGSGYSTLFARRVIDDFGLSTKIVAIDPAPRAEVGDLCDELIRRPLQDVADWAFDDLRAGDVVLFDGSHVALMNSDATVFLLEVLPRLPSGVMVGIDDIFLPSDYPPSWAGRAYGEQYLLAALLLGGGGGWGVRFPAWWLVECSPLADEFAGLWPIVENRFGRHAGSFWLERA
jgi:methyltransferase family protein